jgi:hypothetical protein
MSGFASNQRINQALLLLTKVLQPYVEKRMRDAYRGNWQQNMSVAAGTDMSKPYDAYALLKTMVDNWQHAFRDGLKPIVRNHVSLALAARNDMAHASGTIADTDAISYLRSIQAVVEAIERFQSGLEDVFIDIGTQHGHAKSQSVVAGNLAHQRQRLIKMRPGAGRSGRPDHQPGFCA